MDVSAICDEGQRIMNIVKVYENWGHEEKSTALGQPLPIWNSTAIYHDQQIGNHYSACPFNTTVHG